MSPRIGFIVNPLSHTVQRKGSLLERASVGLKDILPVRIETFADLPDQMRQLADADVSALFVEGGDGTLQAVMSAWYGLSGRVEKMPDLAILPGGSTNLAYKIAGLRCRTGAEVAAYISAYRSGRGTVRKNLPALCVDRAGFALPQVGMLLSTGALARAMIHTQTQFHGDGHRGSLAVAEAAFRFVLAPGAYLDASGTPLLRPSDLAAEGASFSLQGAHALSLMTTLPHLSLGLKPFWGQEGEGAIAFTHAEWPIQGFRAAFLKILTGAVGSAMVRHGLRSYRADAITLTCTEPVVLDGELLQIPPEGRITVRPTQPIRFLR